MTLPLEKQVCSLEYAQKLKSLNCPQDSLWWWVEFNGVKLVYRQSLLTEEAEPLVTDAIYSAFSVAELGEMLKNYKGSFSFYRGTNCWVGDLMNCWASYEDTIANALAKMLIYLLENNLIKAGDLR